MVVEQMYMDGTQTLLRDAQSRFLRTRQIIASKPIMLGENKKPGVPMQVPGKQAQRLAAEANASFILQLTLAGKIFSSPYVEFKHFQRCVNARNNLEPRGNFNGKVGTTYRRI